MSNFRDRIYNSYVKGRSEKIAPETIDGLNPRSSFMLRLVRCHFPDDRSASILDLGCGHGAILHFAREAGYKNLRGVDGSQEQVQAASKLGISGVELGDIWVALMNEADKTHDVVITFDVIEHFTRDELIPIVDAIHRVLKPGGRWIIHVPNGESPFCARMRYWDLTHELAFTRTSLGQLLISSGFTQVSCFEDSPVPHGVISVVRAMLWQVLRFSLLIFVAIETGAFDRRAVFTQNLLAVAVK